MFRIASVTDFQAVLETDSTSGLENLRVRVEQSRDAGGAASASLVATMIKARFEITPLIDVLPPDTLAAEFEKSIKAPRFVDLRT